MADEPEERDEGALAGGEGPDVTVLALAVDQAAGIGERLDKWLVGRLPDRSRAEVQRWISAGLVSRGSQALKASYRLSAHEVITVSIPPAESYQVAPEPIPLTILYEDDDLLVVDKPAGMVVHPAAGNWHGTLVNAVLFHCPGLAGVGGTGRPGIVHRLDKDTSGLIVVAKNDQAHRALQAQFKERTVEKTYLALAHGRVAPSRGEIQAPIGRDPRQRRRMAVLPAPLGRPSTTQYEVKGYYSNYTLLACHPLTGRTHQIRVHLAYIKHPLVGDEVYGKRRASVPVPRQFLHAERLRFHLPANGQPVEFTAPLPDDLGAVLRALEEGEEGDRSPLS